MICIRCKCCIQVHVICIMALAIAQGYVFYGDSNSFHVLILHQKTYKDRYGN